MRIWFALAALAAMGTFSQPAFADMTIKSQDGSLELALPNGWHEGKHCGYEGSEHLRICPRCGSKAIVHE